MSKFLVRYIKLFNRLLKLMRVKLKKLFKKRVRKLSGCVKHLTLL